jgi:hypothetical protein
VPLPDRSLIGNLLLLWDNSIFNAYGNILTGLPDSAAGGTGALSLVSLHAYMGIRVWLENRKGETSEVSD